MEHVCKWISALIRFSHHQHVVNQRRKQQQRSTKSFAFEFASFLETEKEKNAEKKLLSLNILLIS